MRPALIVAVFAGGAVGALLRAGLAELWPSGDGEWPWGTLTANLVGTVLLALVATTMTAGRDPRRIWRALVGTGFCGALTTFSTFQIEVIALVREGHVAMGVSYAVVSLIVGLGVVVAVGFGARGVRSR